MPPKAFTTTPGGAGMVVVSTGTGAGVPWLWSSAGAVLEAVPVSGSPAVCATPAPGAAHESRTRTVRTEALFGKLVIGQDLLESLLVRRRDPASIKAKSYHSENHGREDGKARPDGPPRPFAVPGKISATHNSTLGTDFGENAGSRVRPYKRRR